MPSSFHVSLARTTALFAALAWTSRLAAQAAAVETETGVVRKTLLQELNLPAIWFLVACSLVIVWLVIDLYQKSGRRRLAPPTDLTRIKEHFARGDYEAAFGLAGALSGVLGDAVQAGLRHCSAGAKPAEDAVASSLAGSAARFHTKISYLSVIGVIAPMVGLTGTVLGMIDAFALMGQAGAADPSKLSGAIGHVLHATAGGLMVAIPAFVFYYLLRSRVGHGFHEAGAAVAELFRSFPYDDFAGHSFRGAEPCAARPVWAEPESASEGGSRNG